MDLISTAITRYKIFVYLLQCLTSFQLFCQWINIYELYEDDNPFEGKTLEEVKYWLETGLNLYAKSSFVSFVHFMHVSIKVIVCALWLHS